MPTTSIKEVARHAGVSIGTVSNVLNHPHVVAPATRQRVLDAIAELGYVRNDSARQLRAGRSRMIAIVVLDVANPFFTDVVRAAEDTAESSGIAVMVCNSADSVARERRHLDLLEEQRVQGVLITPVDSGEDSRLERFMRRGIPVVFLDRETSQQERCSVSVDDVMGGRLAGEHLVDQGHRSVAFVGGPLSIPQVGERQRGLLQALRQAPSVAARTIVTPTLTVAAGRRVAEDILALPDDQRPTAAFCANDLLALGLLQGMTHRGVSVPHDVAIVGYDDIEFAAAAAVPLSSIRQPREQLGRTATQLLLEEINDGETHHHRHVVFKPQLIVRRSSGYLRRSP